MSCYQNRILSIYYVNYRKQIAHNHLKFESVAGIRNSDINCVNLKLVII